jgi:uncharacterized membrane protein SpoIIM required for sporulation
MQVEQFVAERGAAWAELEILVARGSGRPSRLSPTEIHRLGALYRSSAADLALASRSWPEAGGTLRLHGLVVQANQVVYAKATRTDTVGEYLGRRLWQRIRELRGCLALSAAILLGSILLGALWALVEPAAAAGLLPAGARVSAHTKGGFYGVSIPGRSGLALAIFVNNLRVSVLALAGGFTGGLVTAYFLAYNGALFGALGAFEWKAGGLGSFLSLTMPHGLLELSCVSIAGGAGFVIAKALIDPGLRTRPEALERAVPLIGSAVLSVAMFLIVAAATEGIITPLDLATPAALAVGLVLAGGFWGMVIWRGRPDATAALPSWSAGEVTDPRDSHSAATVRAAPL